MTMDTPAAVVLELMTMGQQSAKHLGDLLRASSPASPHQELAAEILHCCGRVIDALRAADSGGRKRKAPEISYHHHHQEAAPPAPGAYWSPPPPGPPPHKRRVRGAEAVKEVTSGTTVDGFIWRKYGQKEINGYKHPRLYYRCAHKQQQGCNATRRVQQIQDHPAVHEIAYYGEHTCRGAASHLLLQGGATPPAAVDFGSTSWGSAADAGGASPSPAASVSQSHGGGWSSSPASASPSPSSEVGFELEAHGPWESHDDAAAVDQLIDELIGTAPWYGSDPETEFLDGSLGWESVLNDPLDFATGLHHHIATFQ